MDGVDLFGFLSEMLFLNSVFLPFPAQAIEGMFCKSLFLRTRKTSLGSASLSLK